jgi:hypothetical protein
MISVRPINFRVELVHIEVFPGLFINVVSALIIRVDAIKEWSYSLKIRLFSYVWSTPVFSYL